MPQRFLLIAATLIASATLSTAAPPLKVFVLVGQSNMQGHAQTTTFDHMALDPETKPILDQMRNADGSPKVCDQVWITSIGNGGDQEEYHGQLTSGYGAKGRGTKIGPELTFGIYLQQHLNEPILLIKTAWGGKSLHTDFRPPGSGPYQFNEGQLESLKKKGADLEKAKAERSEASGLYYRKMIDHVRATLNDIKRVYPDYDEASGYQLSGLVWFQGWNDMVGRDVYPRRDQPGGYDLYSDLMGQFIRDVRKDLSSPNLPVVIGVMGVNGPTAEYGDNQRRYQAVHQNFRDAMAAPAKLPEFEGNVAAVLTENYWDAELDELKERGNQIKAKAKELDQDQTLSKQERTRALDAFRDQLYSDREREILKGSSNAAFHYNGCAKIMAQIGKGFAEAMAGMMDQEQS